MSCCSCKNLDEKKKANGACSGAKYYCKKLKTYVSGDMHECDKFTSCYRSVDKCDEIYRDGKNFDNDTTSAGTYIILAIILLVILILLNLFYK